MTVFLLCLASWLMTSAVICGGVGVIFWLSKMESRDD